jgi:hypothetical protein
VTRIAGLTNNNVIHIKVGLDKSSGMFFLEVSTFKSVESIKANPVKAGDAKPRVFRHVRHGYDSLAAEKKLPQSPIFVI